MSQKDTLYAEACRMRYSRRNDLHGWDILSYDIINVHIDDLFLSFPRLKGSCNEYNIHDLNHLHGEPTLYVYQISQHLHSE